MPTVISHAVAATAITSAFPIDKSVGRIWLLGIICSAIPDLDVIGFGFGIHYGDLLGHRGLTHSFVFAILLAFVMVWFVQKSHFRVISSHRLFLFFFVVTASHGILDAMTNGGLGIAFFSPFVTQRYFFPFRPIEVSPIGLIGILSARGWTVLKSEMLWIWIPSIVIIAVFSCLMRKKRAE
jgi:inner membrane protein